jgi:hypothetical protein
MWLMLSGVSVLLLLATYAIVHAGAIFSVASVQLNGPMAVFVMWSVWRATHLFKLQTSVHHTAIDKTQEGAQGNTMNV